MPPIFRDFGGGVETIFEPPLAGSMPRTEDMVNDLTKKGCRRCVSMRAAMLIIWWFGLGFQVFSAFSSFPPSFCPCQRQR